MRAVREHLTEVADAHRLDARRGHPDDAFADTHLRSDARRVVAVARDRVQAGAVLVAQQQQRMLVAEEVGDPTERGAHQGIEIRAAAEALAQLREGGENRLAHVAAWASGVTRSSSTTR